MAVAVLLLWALTAGAGFYLLVTSNLRRNRPVAPAPRPSAAPATRWDPPSLIASRQAPVLPDLRSLLEFAHPAFAIIGLAFWLGFTLVHNKALGWIGFGLVAVTASLGLAWFTANLRAARRADAQSAPRFAGRILIVHGAGAAVTVTLAALAALVLHG
jgi:hypothetical protein